LPDYHKKNKKSSKKIFYERSRLKAFDELDFSGIGVMKVPICLSCWQMLAYATPSMGDRDGYKPN